MTREGPLNEPLHGWTFWVIGQTDAAASCKVQP